MDMFVYLNPWLFAYQTLAIFWITIIAERIYVTRVLRLFYLLFTFLEIWVLKKATVFPVTHPFTITNSLLILVIVSYYRVIHHRTAVFGDPFDIEFRLWRLIGRSTDENLQLNLGKQLRLQQIARRRIKYERIATQEISGRTVASTHANALALEQETAKFGRLEARREVAFQACQRFSLEEEGREAGNVMAVAMRRVDIDKRTGKDILRWLSGEIKESEGFIKPVKWSKDKKTGAITCHNGYTDENVPVDYFSNPDDLIIGSVSVTAPSQIEPALSLIETALDHIRFYDINNFPGHEDERLHPSHTQFRRAVAVSCEMKQYAPEYVRGKVGILNIDDPKWSNDQGEVNVEYVEKDRELVSLLTVSVDRYLTVTFHIAYMLQHSVENTRANLQTLFQDLILNRHKIKIWNNVPRSIAALDATLEHIFRGAGGPDQEEGPGRQSYLASLRKPFRENGPNDILRTPGYKDTGPDNFLHFNRPTDTEFRRGQDNPPCPLQLHGPGLDYADRTCPCDKGIIDITAIVDCILRQHRFLGINHDAPHALRSWAAPHAHSNLIFCDLVRWLLAGHKWQPFLCQFKETGQLKPQKPNTEGLQPEEAEEFTNIYNMRYNMHKAERDKLFTTGGETRDIERDDICLSYVVGEAVGLGLIFRNLLTCESPILMAERLSHYAYKHTLKVPPCAYDTVLFRKPVDRTILPPLEKMDSFTLGLDVDSPETAYGAPSIPTWEKLASNPAWFLKQSTHGKVSKELTFSNVITTAFILTGWEHPILPEVPDPRVPPPKRFGMTTPAKLARNLRDATAVSLAEVHRANRRAKLCAFNLVDKASETNFIAEIGNEFGLRLERAIDTLGGSRSNMPTVPEEIQDENRGRDVDGLTRAARLAARATRQCAQLVYGLRATAINLLDLIEQGVVAALPTTAEEAVAKATADAAIRLMAVGALERASEAELVSRTVYTCAVDLDTNARAMFPNVVPGRRNEELDRTTETYLNRTQTAETTRLRLNEAEIRVHAHSRMAIPAANNPNPDITTTESPERQRLELGIANAVTELQEASNAETLARTAALAEINAAITRREELDILYDDVQSGLDGTRRRRQGERAEFAERMPGLQRAVETDRTDLFGRVNLIRIKREINEAHAAFETARENLEVARARAVADGDTDVMIAQKRLKTARDHAAFATAEMTVSPTPAGQEDLATAQRRLEPAQAAYNDAVEAVHISRGVEMERLLASRTALEDAYLNCVNGTFSTIQRAYDRTTYAIARDFEAPEEVAIVASTQELVGLAEIIHTRARQLRDMVETLSTQSLRSERTSNGAKQSIIQQEVFTARLPTISAGKLVVEGNFGLALTLRNLAARNFRVSYKLMPQEHAAPLLQASNLSNVTWFEIFTDLFEWHCGLGTPEAARITANNPAISTKGSEAAIRQDFLGIVQAEVPDPAVPGGLDRMGAASHLEATRRARERLARLHDYVDLVSAEILIFMLVREISKFEELDASRRLVLGIDSAVYDYDTVVGHSLWESVTIERAKREFQLDNFVYQDAYWFKRLQVLLGHEFAQNISTQSPSSRLVQECGAKDIADLVEMLISEIERFLKIYRYQEELADYLKRTVMNSSKFARRRLVANARAHASKRPNASTGPRDRRSPMQRFERDTAFRSGHLSDMAILQDARAKLADWRLPEWLSYLILTAQKIDSAGTTIERLLTRPPVFLLPDMTMPHAPWMRAIVSLLTSDPHIELDSWDGLRKWWRNGIFIQGIGLADEHVEQSVLPDLANITQDGRAPNPVPQRVIQNRRIHNATHRAFVNTSQLADRGINTPPAVPAEVPVEVPADVPPVGG